MKIPLVIWYISEGELLGKESSSERRAPRKGELLGKESSLFYLIR